MGTMPTTNARSFEVSLKAPLSLPGISGLMREVFVRVGVKPEAIIESKTETAFCVSTYCVSFKKAKALREKFKKIQLRKVTLHLKVLQPKDWQQKWKKMLYPFALTQKIDVVPAWRKKKYKQTKRIPILIDTVTAFGTGKHETTQFMSQLIERCRGKFQNFFDVGTGTGILSLVAFKCGAEEVSAIDISADSTKVAKKNLAVNGYRFNTLKATDLKKLKDRRQYDFVAANLITDKLIEMRYKILSYVRPGKYLAVSGITLGNLSRLQKEFKALPVRCLKIHKGKDWAAILYKKAG